MAPLYISTSEQGVEHSSGEEQQWLLPEGGAAAPPTRGGHLVLREPVELLDVLDEAVFLVEPGEGATTTPAGVVAPTATVVGGTPWDALCAARFALDCAEHVLRDVGDVELPVGFTLAGAIAEARSFLERADPDSASRLGRLARYGAARRVRRTGAKIGDIALAMLEADLADDLDAAEDRLWATTTAAGDAVLAAVEALRQLAAPRYVGTREQTAERSDSPIATPVAFETAWGPVMVGVEHDNPYLPAGVLAREAAFRARESVGPEGESAERAWQAVLLATLLAPS